MAALGEKEVFRITPTMGKCYEWAESTRSSGRFPDERRFAPEQNVIYVGELVDIATEGYGDNSSRTDTFINRETGNQTQVPYSYEGRTCFIEVSCRNSSDKMNRAMAAGRIKRTRNVRKNKRTKRRKYKKTKRIRNKKKYKLSA
jgi:hypothetical protein